MITWVIICIFTAMLVYVALRGTVRKQTLDAKPTDYLFNTENQSILDLLNANTLTNLPTVKFITNHPEIEKLQKCAEGGRYLGPLSDNGDSFKNVCLHYCGSNGTVIRVDVDDEYFINNIRLTAGWWCVTVKPKCNLKTTYAVTTINGIVCRTKYPNIVGGELGTRIIACNNEQYYNEKNVLWDNLKNEAVDLRNIDLNNEDELLPDNTYRFTCKFDRDVAFNRYIEHPLNRFHPIRDPCKGEVFAGMDDVGFELVGTNDWRCNCGLERETRLSNKFKNDAKSPCTSCIIEYDDEKTLIANHCFTSDSFIKDVLTKVPCGPDKFVKKGAFCETIPVNMNIVKTVESKNNNALPKHPILGNTVVKYAKQWEF